VGETSAEGVFQEVEHCEEFARGHEHVVTEPAGNDTVVHDWLVWLVLEVAVPTRSELLAWPAVHLLEFLFRWSDLHTSLDTICSQWASAVDVPLLKDLLLSLWITTDKVVKGLAFRLSTVYRECEVVVLEVETDTRKVNYGLNASGTKLIGVTDTRSLEDERRTECASTNNDLLTSPVDLGLILSWSKGLGGNDLDTDGTTVLEDNFLDLAVADEV